MDTFAIFIHLMAHTVLSFIPKNDGVKALVSQDFGYCGIEPAESVALAGILRRTLGVSVTDYSTGFNDSKRDCEDSER